MFGKKDDEVKITTLIGEGSVLDGNFTAAGSARIDGKVEGDVTVEGTLIVGATGAVDGNVEAEAVLIGGEINGNINAPKKAELTGTARVTGDITTAVIVIDENAVFHGKCDMSQNTENQEDKEIDPKALNASKKSAEESLKEALKDVPETAAAQNEG